MQSLQVIVRMITLYIKWGRTCERECDLAVCCDVWPLSEYQQSEVIRASICELRCLENEIQTPVISARGSHVYTAPIFATPL